MAKGLGRSASPSPKKTEGLIVGLVVVVAMPMMPVAIVGVFDAIAADSHFVATFGVVDMLMILMHLDRAIMDLAAMAVMVVAIMIVIEVIHMPLGNMAAVAIMLVGVVFVGLVTLRVSAHSKHKQQAKNYLLHNRLLIMRFSIPTL